jgi:hypothetical protein
MQIFYHSPNDWKDLEIKTSKIFSDIGCLSSNQVDIETVRGIVNVDVVAEDKSQHPHLKYFCECKYWESEIPQTIIHAFRTVVADSGCHCGFIIAKKGFQAGAFEAIKNSNVYLLTWEQFIETFEERWIKNRIETLDNIARPLSHFCNPMATFFLDELKKLPLESRTEFEEIVRLYDTYATYSLRDWYYDPINHKYDRNDFVKCVSYVTNKLLVNEGISCFSDYFDCLLHKCNEGLNKIDNLFMQKIRKV